MKRSASGTPGCGRLGDNDDFLGVKRVKGYRGTGGGAEFWGLKNTAF